MFCLAWGISVYSKLPNVSSIFWWALLCCMQCVPRHGTKAARGGLPAAQLPSVLSIMCTVALQTASMLSTNKD